jgi:hypothetical protein
MNQKLKNHQTGSSARSESTAISNYLTSPNSKTKQRTKNHQNEKSIAKNHTVQGRFQICEIGSGKEWINRKWNRRSRIWGIADLKFGENGIYRRRMELRMKKEKGRRRWTIHNDPVRTIASCTLRALVFDQLQYNGGEFLMHGA